MDKLINTILAFGQRIVDILLPKEQKVADLEKLGVTGLFHKIPPAPDFDFETEKIKSVFCYRNSLCRQAIWEIKYRANKKLIRDFSLILYDFILEELYDLENFNDFKNIILVPIPSSKSSTREKGFNQCVLICQELMKIDQERKQNNFISIKNLLIKKINTEHQSKTKTRKDRLENLKNTFTVNERYKKESVNFQFEGHSFILIDDVITTGATMNESFRALREAGAKKIIGFSLAH